MMQRHGLKEVDAQGMVLTQPPLFGKWSWRLDKNDTDINWIGTYQLDPGASDKQANQSTNS